MILRAIGIHDSLAVDLITGKAYPGDLFLLCSDGLSDMVGDSHIEETLASDLTLEEKATAWSGVRATREGTTM